MEQNSPTAHRDALAAAQGSDTVDLASALKEAYKGLASGNTAALAPLYSDDVYFEDPSHGIQGKAALVERFQHLYGKVDSCTFKFHQTLCANIPPIQLLCLPFQATEFPLRCNPYAPASMQNIKFS